MKCPNCGANIYDDVNRCQYCGAYQQPRNAMPPQPQQTASAQPERPVVVNVFQQPGQQVVYERTSLSAKNRLVALLLCFFLGGIGAHKFYVGRTGMGVLYLFTVGLFGIGWCIDILVLLLGSPTDKWGRKLPWS